MKRAHAGAIVAVALSFASPAAPSGGSAPLQVDPLRQAMVWEGDFDASGYRLLSERGLSVSGNTAFALTLQEEAYVFTRVNGVWQHTQVLSLPSSRLDASAVAVEGDVAMIGSVSDEWWLPGYVFVYQRNASGEWTRAQTLVSSDSPSAAFGTALDLSGDTLMVIGGPRGSQGDVHVFTRAGGQWTETQKLSIGDGTSLDGGIAVDGYTAVVGVPRQTVAGREFQGAAHVFTRDAGGTWSARQTLLAPDGEPNDSFGSAVALDGDRMLVAASGSADRPSSVYVFVRGADGNWAFETKLLDPMPGGRVNTAFGARSVALSGDIALIGARDSIVTDGRIGAAYLYRRNASGTWALQQRLIAPRMLRLVYNGVNDMWVGSSFGFSVALSSTAALIGDPAADNSAGSVYFYRGYAAAPETIAVGLGTSPASPMFSTHVDIPAGTGNVGWGLVPWRRYLQVGGGMRPALGDVDGDGLDEVVVGLEPVGFANGWLAVLDDAAHGHALLRWIQVQWEGYDSANGEVFPAVGDLDGDGRAEIVAGLGTGGRGYYEIFDDAAGDYQHLAWGQVPWTYYVERDGSTHPAIGDVDGDGTKEIVLGLGSGSNGWLEVVNGASAGYSHRAWLQVPWIAYNAANGTTFPALGDVDGDLRAEIVVGLGAGSGGWVAVMDDGAAGFAHVRWLRLIWHYYNETFGETHPAVGNLDADPQAEIVLGVGTCPGEGGWFEVVDDALAGFAYIRWQHAGGSVFRTAGSATFPAVGRLR